jgi:hypothetical protein
LAGAEEEAAGFCAGENLPLDRGEPDAEPDMETGDPDLGLGVRRCTTVRCFENRLNSGFFSFLASSFFDPLSLKLPL